MRIDTAAPLSKSVRIEDLRKYFHLPIVEVARQLGTCTTALKKICRKNKINKWPYRQIRSITKSIQSLEMASLNDTLNEDLRIQYRQQIVTLQNAIDELIKDPNNVVELVNMGLSEEALQNLRESNAASMAAATQKNTDGTDCAAGSAVSASSGMPALSSDVPQALSSSQQAFSSTAVSSKTSGYALATTGNGGATGVLNLLQWPKPSADVQQIMQAAAQLTTQSGDNISANRKSKAAKRKASELAESGAREDSATAGAAEGSGTHAGTGATSGLDGSVDVSQLEGGNLRHKKVEIGDTIADCSYVSESQRMVFAGPVHLAALQRKKLRPNITRKVVPLMEPDIGSNFGIEFIPQFILSILHTSISSSGGGAAVNGNTSNTSGSTAAVEGHHQQNQPGQQTHTNSAADNVVPSGGSVSNVGGSSASAQSGPLSSQSSQPAGQQSAHSSSPSGRSHNSPQQRANGSLPHSAHNNAHNDSPNNAHSSSQVGYSHSGAQQSILSSAHNTVHSSVHGSTHTSTQDNSQSGTQGTSDAAARSNETQANISGLFGTAGN